MIGVVVCSRGLAAKIAASLRTFLGGETPKPPSLATPEAAHARPGKVDRSARQPAESDRNRDGHTNSGLERGGDFVETGIPVGFVPIAVLPRRRRNCATTLRRRKTGRGCSAGLQLRVDPRARGVARVVDHGALGCGQRRLARRQQTGRHQVTRIPKRSQPKSFARRCGYVAV